MRSADDTAAPPKLLLVDDDELLCSVLARALERRGFAVAVVHDFQSAVAAAVRESPDYAVIDLKFPGGTGLGLVETLIGRDPDMRIVMLTGYASIATAIEAVKRGAHYYLAKPVNADEVVAALGREREASSTAPIAESPLSVNRLEWEHIHRVLTGNNGNISATARLLGMHRRTLQRKLGKHPVKA